MEELVMAVRSAQTDDASAVAKVYIDAWHDTYPGMLPRELLRAMTMKGQTARWRGAMARGSREKVLVAETASHGVVGMTSVGPAQDRGIGYDGEVYTLYVSPDYLGYGAGSMLLRAAFAALHDAGYSSCVIWAHAKNPARFFYEAMGGRLVAERSRRMMGAIVPEVAFGWKNLVLGERRRAAPDTLSRR